MKNKAVRSAITGRNSLRRARSFLASAEFRRNVKRKRRVDDTTQPPLEMQRVRGERLGERQNHKQLERVPNKTHTMSTTFSFLLIMWRGQQRTTNRTTTSTVKRQESPTLSHCTPRSKAVSPVRQTAISTACKRRRSKRHRCRKAE